MADEIVLPDTLTPDEPLDDLASPETVDASKFQELADKNKKLYARAKTAEEGLKALKADPRFKPEEKKETPVTPSQEDVLEASFELQAEGKSPQQILEIKKYAKRTGQSLREAAKDPVIQAYLEKEETKRKSSEATPTPSGRSATHQGKSWDEIASKGTPEEVKAAHKELYYNRERKNQNE